MKAFGSYGSLGLAQVPNRRLIQLKAHGLESMLDDLGDIEVDAGNDQAAAPDPAPALVADEPASDLSLTAIAQTGAVADIEVPVTDALA